jgi:hypothetical protein
VPPPAVELDWSRGMVRDTARGAQPQASVYDAADYLLNRPGMAYKRGGWGYANTAAFSGATTTTAVAYAPFQAGTRVLGVGNNGHVYDTTVAGVGTAVFGAATQFPVVDRPKLIEDKLIFPRSDGTSVPKVATLNGTTLTFVDLAGGPPPGKYLAIYKSRPVLAGQLGFPNRITFGPAAWTPGITTTWTFVPTHDLATDYSYIEGDYPVTGLAALQNALLVFSAGHMERIVGSTPPPDSDMERGTIGATGCIDARSIVQLDNSVIFANQTGVYQTNGVSFTSLTTDGGIESYWQSLFAGYTPGLSQPVSAGMYRGNLLVYVGVPANVCLICNVARRAWGRVTNVKATMFAEASGTTDELYFGQFDRFIGTTSGMYTPTGANKNDADGTPVLPMLETRLFGDGPGVKRFGFGRVSYDLRDAAADNPTLKVSVAEGLEAPTFTQAPESPFGETTDVARRRFSVRRRGQAAAIRFEQTGASAKTELYAVEVEQYGLPYGAGGV